MIMKKTYINPEMEVITMKVQQMLAASVGVGTDVTSEDILLAPEMNLDDYFTTEDLGNLFE